MTPHGAHPFLTVTVAEIYEGQGKLQRAKDILQTLLAADPTHARAIEHLARIQAQLDALAEVPLKGPPGATSDGESRRRADWITLRVETGQLQCKWHVTPEGRRRAEQQLQAPGALNLRQAHFASDGDPAILDVPLDHDQGTLSLGFPATALVVSAALGLGNAEGHFVAIAHSTHISLAH